MKLAIQSEGKAATLEVSDSAFGADYNESLIHQVVTAHLAGARAGSKAQKTRSEARGGGAKPWRQKGTGRARAGTIRSPIWVGGGRAFAAKPRDHSQKVNRKMYRQAMRSMLSELARQERLVVVDDLGLTEPKTKALVERLSGLGLDNVLILVAEYSNDVCLAVRNLPWADVLDLREMNPVSLMRFDKVLTTVDTIKKLEERFA